MNGLIQDLRYALRQLRRSSAVTFTAVLTLALGVNTAIFAVFYQVLLRMMPVRKPNELVLLKASSKFETGRVDMWDGDEQMYFAYPAYQVLREGNNLLEGLAASTVAPATIVSARDADKMMMQWVSGNYFDLLGLQPVLGRLLTPSDDVQQQRVLAFVVIQRTREIGIRMALGADREHIAGLVAKQVVWLLSAGLGTGAFLGWAGVHLLANRDANLARTPVWLFGATGLLLLVVMSLAAALPARRAASVDPMVALRCE